jgi:putative membrane protein
MKFRVLLAVMLVAGCTSMQPGKLTDPQIAMMMRVINLGEIRESQVVRDKTANTTVRDFAQMMINDHEAENNKAEAAMSAKDVNSEDTQMSRQLDAQSGAATDRLRALSGAALDRAYIDREVQAHQNALNLIDTQLVPNARKKVVKDQLADLRKLVSAHLDRAKQLQASLPR